MDWIFLYLHGYQDGDRWSSSGARNHAAVSGCQYGKSCNSSGGCFDLCTEVWNRICLACRTCRLASKLSDLLCGAQKIMAKDPALNKHSVKGVFTLMLKEENWSTAEKSERYRGSGNIQPQDCRAGVKVSGQCGQKCKSTLHIWKRCGYRRRSETK